MSLFRPARGSSARLTVVVGLLLGACTAISTAPPPTGLPCRVDADGDPCPRLYDDPTIRCSDLDGGEGLCRGVDCTAFEPACANEQDDDCDGNIDEEEPQHSETCDGEDEDCDGSVDEGLDQDGDGFSWCRNTPPLDCQDENPAVHPRREGESEPREVCDGIDNDCDPATVDGSDECDPDAEVCQDGQCQEVNCANVPGLCGSNEFCLTGGEVAPRCVATDASCFELACTSPERCDPTSGECVTPAPPGSSCSSDAECATNLCIARAAIRFDSTDLDAGATGICSTTCCSDGDCGDGERCWDSGTGAAACVPTAALAAGSGAPTVSACHHPSQCGQEQCRLGRDDAFRVMRRASLSCTAVEHAEETCDEGDTCSLGGSCHEGRCQYTFCLDGSDCPSGVCIGGGGVGGFCHPACRSEADCGVESGEFDSRCGAFPLGGPGDRVDSFMTCLFQTEGGAAAGDDCNEDSDCRSRACLDDLGRRDGPRRCAASCCSDAQCGAREQCRPTLVGDRWEPRCLPRPMFGATAGPT